MARSTGTGQSGANTPVRTDRESAVQSVREFDEGRGEVVLGSRSDLCRHVTYVAFALLVGPWHKFSSLSLYILDGSLV